ncbi:hypothetical protein A3F45_01440 [Candidatus Curtissbacteria bacterium RIFCSPHIGHO2_12_FULL_41_17]|uniref:Sortase n=2 Tax=Candidatus Curtissiibacteriota TaxID=1752717 RepID=A0A1F5HL48_9BACT|nr:MAG: hypothetical protein A2693_02055 [Candidatus Curtissbacteria bacterium RIFCSPHIGHO2_01_FULL_40_12]OGE04880.1 MAG: hypothetical protein A3F45_01440 [Candidatus Curtissbacteria bacterium RIFCSPHIGHO2_12_FULL_41_17]
MIRLFGLAVVLLTWGFLTFQSISIINQNINGSKNKVETVQKPSGRPQRLYIPKLSRIAAISEGQIVDSRFVVSETGVSFWPSSAIPPNIGNSVIYGHNRANILGGLPKVGRGDLLYVVLDNGQYVVYQISETKRVRPSQVEILNPSDDARLTVYTCDGFKDRERFVIIGRLLKTSG